MPGGLGGERYGAGEMKTVTGRNGCGGLTLVEVLVVLAV